MSEVDIRSVPHGPSTTSSSSFRNPRGGAVVFILQALSSSAAFTKLLHCVSIARARVSVSRIHHRRFLPDPSLSFLSIATLLSIVVLFRYQSRRMRRWILSRNNNLLLASSRGNVLVRLSCFGSSRSVFFLALVQSRRLRQFLRGLLCSGFRFLWLYAISSWNEVVREPVICFRVDELFEEARWRCWS